MRARDEPAAGPAGFLLVPHAAQMHSKSWQAHVKLNEYTHWREYAHVPARWANPAQFAAAATTHTHAETSETIAAYTGP